MYEIWKYPRTSHVQGSRLQQGDEDLAIVPFSSLIGKYLVIEEKVDGANSGISYDDHEQQYLQSRGHFLMGGPREAQFTLFKQWATTHAESLFCVLGDRYIAYGEWLFSKHTVFYDLLPHYWMEFDIVDKAKSVPDHPFYLDTLSRHHLLKDLPVVPARVIWQGIFNAEFSFVELITPSIFKTKNWRVSLEHQFVKFGQDFQRVQDQTDQTDLMEGLYIKWEEDGEVKGRYKFVRPDFISKIVDANQQDGHHINRPITPNILKHGVDLFLS